MEIKLGMDWPPKEETKRINSYSVYQSMLDLESFDFFIMPARESSRASETISKRIPSPLLIARLSADMLFGNSPEVLESKTDPKSSEAARRIIEDNQLWLQAHEASITCSALGDVVWKIRVAEFLSEKGEPIQRVVIEPVDPGACFLNYQGRQMVGGTIAQIQDITSGDGKVERYLSVEKHEPGKVSNELWKIENGKLSQMITSGPIWDSLVGAGVKNQTMTGIPFPLIMHVPNYRTASSIWGISDFKGARDLFEIINNRISRIDHTLDVHASPKLKVPISLCRIDKKSGKYVFNAADADCIAVNRPGEGQEIGYITWDAQLEAAYRELEWAVETLLLVTDTNKAALGMGEARAESGFHLALAMNRSLAKVNRKRRYMEYALRQMLYTAQLLEISLGIAPEPYTPERPEIKINIGLPHNVIEEVNIAVLRKTNNLATFIECVRDANPDKTDKQTEEMAKEIKNEMRVDSIRSLPAREGGRPPVAPLSQPVGSVSAPAVGR